MNETPAPPGALEAVGAWGRQTPPDCPSLHPHPTWRRCGGQGPEGSGTTSGGGCWAGRERGGRDASGRHCQAAEVGTEGAWGGRGQSPAWHLPLQDGESGESQVQPRPPPGPPPRPAKGRGDDKTNTPRHSLNAGHGFKDSVGPSEPCEAAAASNPVGTGARRHSDARGQSWTPAGVCTGRRTESSLGDSGDVLASPS